MNRREWFSRFLGTACTASGAKLTGGIIEPRPGSVAIVTCPWSLSPQAKANIRAVWDARQSGGPPLPIIILDGGMDLKVVSAYGEIA